MKTTINTINTNLSALRQSQFNKIELKVKEIEQSFIDSTMKGFKVDLSNKTANNSITTYLLGVNFTNSVKDDIKELVEGLNPDSEEDTKVLAYYSAFAKVATTQVNNAMKPLNIRISEMEKALKSNDMDAFNSHMVACFGTQLSKDSFTRLKDMALRSNRGILGSMSGVTFRNLFMSIMTYKQAKGGSFSYKHIDNALKNTMKEVPTITEQEHNNIISGNTTRTFVDDLCNKVGIKVPTGDSYDYSKLIEKLRNAANVKYAILPTSLQNQ